MAKRMFLVVAIIAVAALAGAAGLTVMATGDGAEGQEGDFMDHLHKLGRHLHGEDHHMDQMTRLIEQLELTPDQMQRLEKLHEIIGSYGSEKSGSMAELHDRLVTQFEQGRLETDEIRGVIDGHVEQIREMAYAGTDELIALVNGLDSRQREIVLTHLQGNQKEHHSDGP